MRNFIKPIAFIGICALSFGFAFSAGAERGDIAAPSSPSPFNGGTVAIGDNLQWSSVSFPGGQKGGYILEIQNVAGSPFWVDKTSFVAPSNLIVNSTYSWRVRACIGLTKPANSENSCGPWSNNGERWKFTAKLKQPTLISPRNSTSSITAIDPTTLSIKLEWGKVLGADSYKVTLKDITVNFPQTFELLGQLFVEKPSFLIPKNSLILTHSYTWEVTPMQGKHIGPTSEKWNFVVGLGKPELLFPEANAKVPFPLEKLEWKKVVGVTSYLVSLFNGDGKILYERSASQEFFSDPLNQPEVSGLVGATYGWQVRACNPFPDCGESSRKRTFTLVFAPPEIIAPNKDGFVTQEAKNLALAWNRPGGYFLNSELKYFWEIRELKKGLVASGNAVDAGSLITDEAGKALQAGTYDFRVKACFKDGSNCGDWGKKTFVVTISPQDITGSVRINNGASSTNTANVNLKLTCNGGCEQMRIANVTTDPETAENDLDKATVQDFRSTVEFWPLLSQGDGKKAVVAQFRKKSGEWSPVFADSIEFRGPLGALAINGNRETTDSDVVTLTIDCKNFSSMRIVNDDVGKFPTAEAERCVEEKNWILSNGDGIKWVYAEFSDSDDGPWVSQVSDKIELKKVVAQPPTPTGEFLGKLSKVLNIAFLIFTVIAVFAVFLVAFQLVTSGGNKEKVFEARNKLMFIVGGIVLALLARGVPNVIMSILGIKTEATPAPKPVECGEGKICNPLNADSFVGLLNSVINIVFAISLIVMPLMVIWAAVIFVTGGSKPDKIAQARNILIWTMVGFLVILIAKGLPSLVKDILGL